MRRSLVVQHLRPCESSCHLVCQMPDFCNCREYKIRQKRLNPPFLDDVGLERQWADDAVQFLDNGSGFVRSRGSVNVLTKKRPQALPVGRSSIAR